jgi:hypothetical protein
MMNFNGLDFVLTSADVIETSAFCVSCCTFHGYQPLANGDNLIGSFVGNAEQCSSLCAKQSQLPTPNNSIGADAIVNAIAHELSETVTDPLGTS